MKVENKIVEQLMNELAEMRKRIAIISTSNKHTEDCFIKLNKCFLGFGIDPEQNINHLVALCGELMGATCALYNRLDRGMLCSVGQWNTPPDYNPIDNPEGHICYDIIQQADDRMVVIRNLLETLYAQTDSNVKKYKLQTYVGRVVRLGDTCLGALCVVYQRNFIPGKEEERLMGAIASAIAVEEERKKAEEALRKSEEELRMTFENAKDAIFWADPRTGMITNCNRAAESLLEKKKDEIIGFSQTSIHPPEKLECYARMFKKHIEHKGAIDEEAEVITKSGKIKPVHITASVTSVGGKPIIQGIFRDITERKRTEEELKSLNKQLLRSNRKLNRLVLKDPQTGLYNHRYFGEIVESEFYRANRYTHPLSLIMLDIDYFKSVNDAYGHRFGDLVLKQFAKKLRKLVRLHDHVIRFGDEEFVILLPGISRFESLNLGQRLLDSIKVCDFGNRENTVNLRLSMAVVSYPEDEIFKAMDLIELAEKILNKAKEYGGDRICSCIDIKNKALPLEAKYEITNIEYLRQRLAKLTKQSNQSLIESIFAFAKTIELKDHYTGDHVERTVYYAAKTARRLGLTRSSIKLIEQASMLHDLGKIGISERILLKEGRLTKKEFDKIKEHPKIGVDIIRPIQFLHGLIPLILYHHERWDGKGYPCGLKGEEIPVGARIVAIADVYHALISDRPYRKAFSRDRAIDIIKENSGTQFDPKITDAFLEILQKA